MPLYRPPVTGRVFFLTMFGVFGLAAVGLVAATIAGGPDAPPVLFTLVWLGAVAWNAYWWLYRFAVSLSLDDGHLGWRGALRSGRIPLPAVLRIRPMRLASNVQVIEHAGGRPVLVLAGKGLPRFLDETAKQRPELEVRLGLWALVADRFPGLSGWRPRG